MRLAKTVILAAGVGALLAGCAMQPVGPTVRVMPAPYKPFDVFEREQYECEQYADREVAGEAQAANGRAVGAVRHICQQDQVIRSEANASFIGGVAIPGVGQLAGGSKNRSRELGRRPSSADHGARKLLDFRAIYEQAARDRFHSQ